VIDRQAFSRREKERAESGELQRLQEVFTAQQLELVEMQRRLATFMTKGAHVVEAVVAEDDAARRTALEAAKARVGSRNGARSRKK
jgi:division protein CdvB (Snf7/Vps24/ESCRT-III family)